MALADLIDAHRGAFEYDWRARFQLPISVIGEQMSYGEAIRLARALSSDPSSMIAASANGWDGPRSREWFLLADLYDLTHQAAARKRPTPYPRPTPAEGTRKFGKTRRTRAEVISILAAHGHSPQQKEG